MSTMSYRIGSYDSAGPHEHEHQHQHQHAGERRMRRSIDEDDGPGYKRQRTALACNSCRYRKSRCNGAHPTCSTCRDLGFDCVYRGPAPAPRVQNRDIQSMEKRLQKFEDLLLSIANKQHQQQGQGQGGGSDDTSSIMAPSSRPQFASQHDANNGYNDGPTTHDSSSSSLSNLNMEFQQMQAQSRTAQRDGPPMYKLWPVVQEDTVDGMGSIIFADESSSGFFGPSSNSAFFSKIAKVLASGTVTMPEGKDFTRDLAGKLSRPPSPPPQTRADPSPVNPYKLPSRMDIFRLIEIFFSFTGQFFPYISKSSLTQLVEELDMPQFGGVRKSGLCLLNAVLAMGTSLDSESGRQAKFREAESDIFFQRALILSPWTISNTANLETLQALTVMTQYLQGTSRSAQTWKLHGLLVQAAFQLGAYTKDSSSRLSACEQEIRTRIWYTCIILDRIFSTTFGRPLLIHNELIPTDMPLDVELDQLPKDRPSQSSHSSQSQMTQQIVDLDPKPSASIIFTPSIKLYCIQGDIIRNLFNHNVISSQTLRSDELFSKIIQLDRALEHWKRELHPTSQLLPLELIDTMDPDNWVYSKVQTTLTLRYLNVRALLFRKVVEHSLDAIAKPSPASSSNGGSGNSSGNNSSGNNTPPPVAMAMVAMDMECSLPIGKTMIQGCADSCVQTITIIRRIAAKSQLLPAWWYTAYYVFNSALILFGVICLQTLGKTDVGTKPAAELVVCLQSGLEALEVVGKETRIVRRCSKYLRKIILVSTLLVRNHVSAQQIPAGVSALINSLPNGIPPSISDGSTPSPLNAEFGQFLIDEDYAFLDVWTDLAQEPMAMANFPNP